MESILQAAALRCLQLVITELAAYIARFNLLGGMALCMTALEHHRRSVGVQVWACALLAAVGWAGVGEQTVIVKAGGLIALCKILRRQERVLRAYRYSKEKSLRGKIKGVLLLVQHALTAVVVLLSTGTEQRTEDFMDLNGFTPVVRILKWACATAEFTILSEALRLLHSVCSDVRCQKVLRQFFGAELKYALHVLNPETHSGGTGDRAMWLSTVKLMERIELVSETAAIGQAATVALSPNSSSADLGRASSSCTATDARQMLSKARGAIERLRNGTVEARDLFLLRHGTYLEK